MTLAASPMCVGITAAAASAAAASAAAASTVSIAGHAMAEIPGGLTVMGSSEFENATPRWVSLSPYLIAEMATSDSQYCEVAKHTSSNRVPWEHPAVFDNDSGVLGYFEGVKRDGLVLPTEAQWENAARGPAVNIREVMEEELGRFILGDVVDFVEGRFENLVFGIMGQIFTDPKAEQFQKLIDEGRPFFGWRVFATPSGRLSHHDIWYSRKTTAPVNWGPPNAYGLYNMSGNVSEYVRDGYSEGAYLLNGADPSVSDRGQFRVIRGGSWRTVDAMKLLAAFRGKDDSHFQKDKSLGFRVAAPIDAVRGGAS